ncbi:uncharacterized protein LOC124167284 [Ischnura elegans]|uniref:uncharacterized protein LOC124167284 n=1 Tax=Ischnura elegans TaxID=197161 RepID=UPI001ED888F2|nr:uncharacterized protein LOC124167284 [Ischnura elegans]
MGADPTVKECGSLSPLEMAKLMNKEDEDDLDRKFILDLIETAAVVKNKEFQNVTDQSSSAHWSKCSTQCDKIEEMILNLEKKVESLKHDLRLSTDTGEIMKEYVISLQPGVSGASQCKAVNEVSTEGEKMAKNQTEVPDVKPSGNGSLIIESDELGCGVEIGMSRKKLEEVPECIEDTASLSESTEDSTFLSVHGEVDDGDKMNVHLSEEDKRCHESSLLTAYESNSCNSLDNEEYDELTEEMNNCGSRKIGLSLLSPEKVNEEVKVLERQEITLSEGGNIAGKRMHDEFKQMDIPLEESVQCTHKEPSEEHTEFTKEVEQFKKGCALSEVVQDGIKESPQRMHLNQGLSIHKGEVFSPVEDPADKSSKGDIEICNVNDSDQSNGKEMHFPRCLMGITSPSMHQKVDAVPSEHAPVPGGYISNHVQSKEPVAKEDLFSSLDTEEKNIRLKETSKIDRMEVTSGLLSSEKAKSEEDAVSVPAKHSDAGQSKAERKICEDTKQVDVPSAVSLESKCHEQHNEKLLISIEELEPKKGHFKQPTRGISQVIPDSKVLQEEVSSNQVLNVLQEKDLSTEKDGAYRSNENLNTDKGKDAVKEAGCAIHSGKTSGKVEHVPPSIIDTITLSSAEASHEYSVPTQKPGIMSHLEMTSQVPLAEGNAGTNVGFLLRDKVIRERVLSLVEGFERRHGGTKMIRETKDDGASQVASGITSPGKAKIEEDALSVPSKHLNAGQRSAIRKIGENGKQIGVPTGVPYNQKRSSKTSIDSPIKGPSVKKRSAEEAYNASEENGHCSADGTPCGERKLVPHNAADDVKNSVSTTEFLHSDKKPKIHTYLSDEVIGGNGSSALISKDIDDSEFPSPDVAIQELDGCVRMPRINEALKQLTHQNQEYEANLSMLQVNSNILQPDEDVIILGKSSDTTVEDIIEGVNKLGFIDANQELPKEAGEGGVSSTENKKLEVTDKGETNRLKFREAGVAEFKSTSSSPVKDDLFADNGLLFVESSIASSEREKSEDISIPDECVSGNEKLNAKKANSTETASWRKTLSRLPFISKMMKHGSDETCANKELLGNASEGNAGVGNPCEMQELERESHSSEATQMTTVSLKSNVLDFSFPVPIPDLSSSGVNFRMVGSQAMYCSQTSRDENIHPKNAGNQPYQEMRDLQGKASCVAQSPVGIHQVTDMGYQSCVKAMMAMTDIHESSEYKLHLVRKFYEKLYSNCLLGSIMMKFVAMRDLRLKIDCETDTIHRMIPKFRDHDGMFVNGSERSTHVDFQERVIYFAMDMSKNDKEFVCLSKLGSSLCLMSVYLAFSNGGRPYEVGNREKMAEFHALIEGAMAKKRRNEQLMRCIKKALDKKTRLGKEIAMVVALSEIISQDGLKSVLERQLPSLLHFFENHVILTIEKKTEGMA